MTFIEDCPARGTVRYIGKEEDGSGNMRTIVGLEMVGNPYYNLCIKNIKITFLNFLVASQNKNSDTTYSSCYMVNKVNLTHDEPVVICL